MLKAVERGKGGRGKKGGISEYARGIGKPQPLVSRYVSGASVVAGKPITEVIGLLDYVEQLYVIHSAPDSDWPDLVERMLAGHWTKEQTERYVEVINGILRPWPGPAGRKSEREEAEKRI